MLDKLCRDSNHLGHLLGTKLRVEDDLRIAKWIKQGQQDVVDDWQKTVSWLRQVSQQCGFQCDAFALAVHILDTFLGLVKVHGKYLKCAATTSCYIAAKLTGEKETTPSLKEFLELIRSKFTVSDIQRMERIILEKIDWNVDKPTAATFLEIYFSLLCADHFKTLFGSDTMAYSIYRSLCSHIELCVCSLSLQNAKGSMKALALLSCTLEKITSRWFSYIEELALLSKMGIQELLHCRDIIKAVVYGIHKKTPRVMRSKKKVARRRSSIVPRRSPLSPIVENPFEAEFLKHHEDLARVNDSSDELESVMEGEEFDLDDSFSDELKRLRHITISDLDFGSPAKRRKLVSSCGIQSQKADEVAGCSNHVTTTTACPVL